MSAGVVVVLTEARASALAFAFAALASLESSGQDLLVEIEGVYADFGYPGDMEPFIYYMPSDEGESSQEALIGRFRSFLVTERARLCL